MTLSSADTVELVFLVLSRSQKMARRDLYFELNRRKSNEGQFYQGIIKYAPGLRLTTDDWFDLLSKLPNRVLRSDLNLTGLLSEEQLKRLPPIEG